MVHRGGFKTLERDSTAKFLELSVMVFGIAVE